MACVSGDCHHAQGTMLIETQYVKQNGQVVVTGSLHSVDEKRKVVSECKDVVVGTSLYIMRPLLDGPKTCAV